jgi:hypothetical protein
MLRTRSALTGALVALALIAAAMAASPAFAEERTCRGTLGAVTVDNLRVPQQPQRHVRQGDDQGRAERDAHRPRHPRRRQRPG